MLRLFSLAVTGLFGMTLLMAQTSDVVVFSEMGEKFTLIIDGDVKNQAPATRVIATGIRNETPLLVVRLAEGNLPPVKQNAWMEFGKEYTLKLTTNKKGEYVLRMQGQTELGTTKPTEASLPPPTNFVEDAPSTAPTKVEQTVSGGGQTTTTTIQTTEGGGLDGEKINMNVGINGVGINMNVSVDEGVSGSSTTTTTHTTTTTVNDAPPVHTTTVKEPPVYSMPGYSGPIGCAMPMSATEFAEAKKSIEAKGFEESKMTLAKQIGASHCFSVDQVKEIMGLFGFEDSKLDLAKFAYDHTHDLGNYYKVNDAFSFESSIDALDKYIKSR
jgi:Domain of unknown function (DUF4476)